MAMKVERVQVQGVDLEVIRGGEGPTVVLLHGPTVYSPEASFLGMLSRGASIVAPSHPGFGRSTCPDDFDTVYDLVHFYQDFLDTLPDERVTLIGCSFGGWLAAELAVNYGHRLARLVLVDAVGIKVGGREERDIVHHFNTSPAELERRAWHDPTKHHSEKLGLGWQQHLDAMSDEEMVTLARGWDALCLYAWRPHLFNPRLKRWLHRISVPTLVLWGASDQIVSPSYGRAYADLIPGSRFEVIQQAGHHPELEQPAAFVQQVLGFIGA